MIAVLCTFLALLVAPILGQHSQVLAPPSPCPTMFTYDQPGSEPGWWSGVVTLSTEILLHSLWLDIVLDSQAIKIQHKIHPSISAVDVFAEDGKNFRIENEDTHIKPGIPVSLRFSVQYDTNDEVPRVQAIKLNGEVICNALSAEEQADSTLKTNIIYINMIPVINPSQQPIYPVNVRPGNRSGHGNISNAGDNFSGFYEQTQCGTSTLESRWPWVVAIYNTNKMCSYSCGGSLLSYRHVITSAKCVSQTDINHNGLVVHLGKQNLNSVRGAQIRLVQEIIISPDFDLAIPKYHEHDVALLVLQEPVTYTDWVRPVCLWPASKIGPTRNDLEPITIGKKGWLVGWSFDEKDDVIEQLSEVEMPLVSQETCIKSEDYLQYGVKITMNYYCAGDRDTDLCSGVDLGNGMVFNMGNTWYLRGHVSYYIHRAGKTLICDPKKYLMFSDVAKSVSWIHSIVSSC